MMSDLPRDDLFRMVPFPSASMEVREDGDDDGRLMVGTPIVFNTWTEISGWWGDFMERIDPGALTKTLSERGERVKVLFNHGFDPQIGDKPLGKPRTMEPRADALYTETPLARTSYNDDLIELLRAGAIDGMSFRFSVTREEVEEEPEPSEHNPRGLPERTVKELRLYEFGPVTFPAYEATTVGVRSREAFLAWRTAQNLTPLVASGGPVFSGGVFNGDLLVGERGIEITLPPGNFTVSNPVTITGNTFLSGAARAGTPDDPGTPPLAPVGSKDERLLAVRRKTPIIKEMTSWRS